MAYAFVSEKTGKPLGSKKRSTRKTSAKKSTKKKVDSNTKKITEIVKTMNNVAEPKVQSLANVYGDSAFPVEVPPAFGPLYYRNYCLGAPAATWVGPTGSNNFTGLDGF